MTISPLAGKLAPREILVDVDLLERAYYEQKPDPDNTNQLVSFGTSGHRGSPFDGSFTEAHILAITRRSAITVVRNGSRARFISERTRTVCPRRLSAARSKCWPPTKLRRLFNRTMVSHQRL